MNQNDDLGLRKSVFEALANLSPTETNAILKALPPDVGDKAARLKKQLLFSRKGSAKERPAIQDLTEPNPLPPRNPSQDGESLEAGSILGPYRIVKRLAKGGMGSVYLGVRNDGIKLEVAIKTLHHVSPRMRRLFQEECRLLSSLKHRHIAHLLDGGVMDNGLPWMAMEYVKGMNLLDYAKTHDLDVHERLGLCLQVCDALSHAHQQLIIHRDLKPDNILVTEQGQVKLLDFGIAALLDPSTGEQTTLTLQADRLLTPEYASPEQVQGFRLGATSDVYSLGVVLYELLVGQRPYEMPQDPLDILKVICTQPIIKPSQIKYGQAKSPISRKLLRGDLDTILLKALERDPKRRYPSIEAFANDLKRFLKGEAVLARPATLRYRLQKSLQRHPWPLAMGALFLVFLCCFIGFSRFQSQRNAMERDQARAGRESAEAVSKFLVTIFEEVDPAVSKTEDFSAFDLMEVGRQHLSDLADEVEAEQRLRQTMGRVYFALGHYNIAMDLYDNLITQQKHLQQNTFAAEVSKAMLLLATDDLNASLALLDRLSESLDQQSRQDVMKFLEAKAQAFRKTGDYEASQNAFDQALALAQAPEKRMSLRLRQSQLMVAMGKYNEAIVELEDILDFEMARKGLVDANTARVMQIMGYALMATGQYDRAETLYNQIEGIHRQLYAENHPKRLNDGTNRLSILIVRGNFGEAEVLAKDILKAQRAFYQNDDHLAIASLLDQLGKIQNNLGKYEEAEANFRESLAMVRSLFGPFHTTVSTPLYNLGHLMFRMNRYDEAFLFYEQALAINETEERADHPRVGQVSYALGSVMLVNRDWQAAIKHFTRAVEVFRAAHGPNYFETGETLLRLGTAEFEATNYVKAEDHFNEARTIFQQSDKPRTLNIAELDLRLGLLYSVSGEKDLALTYLERGLANTKQVINEQNPEFADTLSLYAQGMLGLENLDIAISSFQKAHDVIEQAYGADDLRMSMPCFYLAKSLEAKGDFVTAVSFFDRAWQISKQHLGASHPQTVLCREALEKTQNVLK